MHYSILRWTNFAVIGLMAVAISSTGCRTGWKMPGTDLFSFKSKPSESMIAGQPPTVTAPTSPSSKYDPKAITSTVTGGTRPTSLTPSGSSNAASGFASNSSPAQANGFQTGPYKMASAPSSGSVGMPNQQTQSSMPNANYGSGGMPNNYAQAPAGSMPASNPASLSPGYAYSGTTPTYAQPAPQTYAGATAAGIYGYPAGTSAPNAVQSNAQLAGTATPPSASYPPIASYPATSTYVPVGNTAGTQTYAPPTSYATQTSPASYGQPATASLSSAGGYRPGSTGRTTSYDLPPAGSGYPATNNPGMTAAGSNSPGYAVPPIMR